MSLFTIIYRLSFISLLCFYSLSLGISQSFAEDNFGSRFYSKAPAALERNTQTPQDSAAQAKALENIEPAAGNSLIENKADRIDQTQKSDIPEIERNLEKDFKQ